MFPFTLSSANTLARSVSEDSRLAAASAPAAADFNTERRWMRLMETSGVAANPKKGTVPFSSRGQSPFWDWYSGARIVARLAGCRQRFGRGGGISEIERDGTLRRVLLLHRSSLSVRPLARRVNSARLVVKLVSIHNGS